MKSHQYAQRRRPSPTGPGISLFPFLAVLICTMGALVPLLLAISRTARLQAEAAALAKAGQQGAELQTQREDVQWRIAQLKRSRQRTESQLADARLQLGHIEDHSRRLRGQLVQYEKAVAEIEGLENADHQQRSQLQAELEQVQSRIGVAQRQLGDASQAATGRQRSYAVVPYEGPNQTHRRPIYLECRADAIVLQPEGVEFTDSDFDGPLGPGNPLAAALRATREHMLAQRDFDPQAGEPYPMLLVRPEGINAYYAARAAMKSWGGDFGYELIGDDWKLAFPSADRNLIHIVEQAVASARVSQARLAAAAPRHYPNRPKTTYRAAPTRGGFVREGGGPPDDENRGYTPASPAGLVGGARGDGWGAGGEGRGTRGDGWGTGGGGQGTGEASNNPYLATTGGQPFATSQPTGQPLAVSQPTDPTDPTGPQFPGADDSDNPLRGDVPKGQGTSGPRTSSYASYSHGSGGTSSGGNAATSGPMAEPPEGYVVGQPPREHGITSSRPSSSDSAMAQRGQVLRPGEWQPSPDMPPPKRDDKDDKPDDKRGGKHEKSLAEKRGVDWGLRDAARGSFGVTRPIRVECDADRLIVVSERGPASNKVIPLGPRCASSIDTFISAVWEHMEAWGIAGRGMYWRPMLQVHVAPDAEQRFVELAALLEGSGLMVERK